MRLPFCTKGQLSTLFLRAYDATVLLLANDVFSRFVRAKSFIEFVEKADAQLIEKIGGVHLTKLPTVMLQCEHYENQAVTVNDFQIFQHMSKDFYHWEMIAYDKKKNTQVFVGNNTYTSKELHKKYGDSMMAKLVCYIDGISAREWANILASTDYFTVIFKNFGDFKVVEHFEGSKYAPSYTVIHEKMNMGPIFSTREFLQTYTLTYIASTKTYLFFMRSCTHPKVPYQKKYVGGQSFTGYFVQDIDENRVRIVQVLNLNWGGYVGYFLGSKAWKSIAMSIGDSLHAAKEEYLKRGKIECKEESPFAVFPQYKDEYKLLQTMVQNGKNEFAC